MDFNLKTLFVLFGLLLDLAGFVGLYRIKQKGLNKMPNVNRIAKYRGTENDTSKLVDSIVGSLNNSISIFNKELKKNDDASIKFFLLIICGFVFQLVSLFIRQKII